MARARRRKQTAFQTDVTKSVFLYGEPNKEKLSLLIEAQARFLSLVNEYIQLLAKTEGFTLQLVKNDKKDSGIRKLEKQHRKPDVNSAASQNAFDMAVTRLSVRLDAIRIEMLSENATVFTRSKVLFAMSIEEKGQKEMEDAIAALSKKEGDFYDTCAAAIRDMDEAAFASAMREFHDSYGMCSIGYKIPELSSVEIPLDSRLMKILPSENIKAPYVLIVSNPFKKRDIFTIPLNTSKHSRHKIRSRKKQMAGAVSLSVRKGKVRVAWAYTQKMSQPKTAEINGVDVGVTDALYVSNGERYCSMQPVLDLYKDIVEPAFAELSDLRNKKRKIRHFLRTHPDIPEDGRRSLIKKMDRLDHMIQTMQAPYRKQRHYLNDLKKMIADTVHGYIHALAPDTLTVLELLDIKEFDKSRKANGMLSTFARGELQKRLMQELNWHGFDFMEVDPAYTSQVCPVCGNLDKENRNGKTFHCTCCGHKDDADHNASVNIRARAMDKELLALCEKYKYSQKLRHEKIREYYQEKKEGYKQQTPSEAVHNDLHRLA